MFVYFGYPHALEQDAERALRAGLAVIRELGQLKPIAGAAPAVRIGVATRLVVVGNVAEGGSAEKVDVTGETPNLAARAIQAWRGPTSRSSPRARAPSSAIFSTASTLAASS